MTTENPTPDQAAHQAANPATDTSAEPSAAELNPEIQIGELERRLAEMSDAYLRAKAEVENTRRRAEDEVTKVRKFALEAFAESLLPVLDSLDGAITAAPGAAMDAMLEGVHATRRQLLSALERNRVLEVNPEVGAKFDPHQHQAISMVPAAQEANTIVGVLQKGYLINERVLRPALVTVAAPQ